MPPASAVIPIIATYWKWSETSDSGMNDIFRNPRTGSSPMRKYAAANNGARPQVFRRIHSHASPPMSSSSGSHAGRLEPSTSQRG